MSKILFLDFDGVVNTPQWYINCAGEYVANYSNKGVYHIVNNYQACQWVSEFCLKNDYQIVVSSSWRINKDCKAALYNGGLRIGVPIVGETPILHGKRGDEIDLWLKSHPEVTDYIIFDDENDLLPKQKKHLVQCTENGFLVEEFTKAQKLVQSGKTKI